MTDDPTKNPNYVGSLDYGVFYPPDPRTRARQIAHQKHEIYAALNYLLEGQRICLNDEIDVGAPRLGEAGEMLTTAIPPDVDAESLGRRAVDLAARIDELGDWDKSVRKDATEMRSELEPFADFDFHSDEDPPGWA